MKRHATPLLLVILTLIAGGCSTAERSFPGHSAENVWGAMVIAAQTPEYDDWLVIDNEVWSDPDLARMEVFRLLERDVRKPGTQVWRHQDRTFRFQIMMVQPEEEGAPPAATFKSRGWAVPAWVGIEADRFFYQVDELLGAPTAPLPMEPVDAMSSGDVGGMDSGG